MNKLIKELVVTMKAITPEHSITQKDTAAVPVFADKERLRQVLTNMLTNAIKIFAARGQDHLCMQPRCAKYDRERPRFRSRHFQVRPAGNF